MQHTRFSAIGDFLDYISEDELVIVEMLRKLVFECIPDCKEKLAYNVPFYYRHSRICFIWPASVPWGGVENGVAIGFCRGNFLSDEAGYLERSGRKEILTKPLPHPIKSNRIC
jgi:hypothetical protein